MMTGCLFNVSSEIITDENTTPDIAIIEKDDSEMLTHHHMYDNMDRGDHDYSDKTLAIDPSVSVTEISRVMLFFR